MVNTNLFQAQRGQLMPATDAINSERAPAFAFEPRHALAQYAATGCLNRTFYADEQEQLATVLALGAQVDEKFLARTAIWAREKGHMKDMPALLLAILSTRNTRLLEAVFPRVVDNGKMLRNFVQVMRSGAVGRKSLGTTSKRLVQRWLDARTDEEIFRASVGSTPSLADVVKMMHPKPGTESRKALYGWLLGRPHDVAALPECVRAFEAWKKDGSLEMPHAPMEMMTALPLSDTDWRTIAERASWHQTRMNLNTFARHGVFGSKPRPKGERLGFLGSLKSMWHDAGLEVDAAPTTKMIAERLGDRDLVARSRVFPYQILAAYRSADPCVPKKVFTALEDALEIATQNVPTFAGKVWVCPDVSGSMQSPVTGHRAGSTTTVRCIDVAGLIASCVLRKNPEAEVLPFEDKVVSLRLNARDTVMTNAEKLAKIGGGGTNCSAPIQLLNETGSLGDLVIFVSDNESWIDARHGRGTALLEQWEIFKRRNPRARLVCLDVQPNRTTQALDRDDILNIGGFSDHVFTLIAEFAEGRLGTPRWVEVIEEIAL
jgi:60 kDa SS-A/Ro ribonucleoprotein